MEWDNKEDILTAVKQDGMALEDASARLRDDKDIVLSAVRQKGWALEYASERLKDDKEVVLTVVKQDEMAVEYASPGIQKLCEGQDPVEVLTRAIQAEKLQAKLNKTLAPKHENTRRIKI